MTTRRRAVAATYPAIERRDWHFVKNFSFDTIVNVFGVALFLGLPIFYWTRTIDARLLSLEVTHNEFVKSDVRRDVELRDQRMAVSTRLEKIESSLIDTRLAIEKLNTTLQNNQSIPSTRQR